MKKLPLPPELDGYLEIVVGEVGTHHICFSIWVDGEECIDGSVKWDGCSNWNVEHCMHFCERDQFAKLAKAFEICWDYASKNIQTFDA